MKQHNLKVTVSPQWYSSHDTLVTFASVLHDAGSLMEVRDAVAFFEAPYKYEREYNLWKLFDFPMEGDKAWGQFVEAVIEDVYAEELS